MSIKVKIPKTDEEENALLDNAYSKFGEKMDQPLKFCQGSSAITWDEKGNLIAPETRQIKCGCGNNILIFLIQKPTKDQFLNYGIVPVWAGYCTKCKGGHVRGHESAVMNDRQYEKFLKLGHKAQRAYMHKRKRRRR